MKAALKTVLIVVAVCAVLSAILFWVAGRVVITVQLRDDVGVALEKPLTLETQVVAPVEVDVDADVNGRATVKPFAVAVDQTVRIPLRMTLDVPLDAKVLVDETIPVRTTVPIDMVLTEKELDLSRLEIPIDDSVFIDDVILVNTTVPIDSTAETVAGIEVPVKMNVPVKLRIPVKQKVRVRDKLVLGLKSFRIPFHVDLPVNADVPFKQEMRVSGTARVPVNQVVAIPLKQQLDVTVPETIPVEAEVKGHAAATITAPVKVSAALGDGVRAKVGAIQVDTSQVSVRAK